MADARVARPPGEDEADEFRYHTGVVRPSEAPDAVEFVEVHKSFGRNHVLRGLNMGLPEGKISMIIGPSGTGKSVCI
jgi:phospholipid/cholesterol/gamma-HCH transport system ATP-binding protein